jgi:hypothetical protein
MAAVMAATFVVLGLTVSWPFFMGAAVGSVLAVLPRKSHGKSVSAGAPRE